MDKLEQVIEMIDNTIDFWHPSKVANESEETRTRWLHYHEAFSSVRQGIDGIVNGNAVQEQEGQETISPESN